MNSKLEKEFDKRFPILRRAIPDGTIEGGQIIQGTIQKEIKQFIDKNFIAKEEDMTNQAIAQFTGYIEAKKGFPVGDLVESMG